MPKLLNAQQVKERLQITPAPVLVEALPAKYFRDRHLPGAINLPHDSNDAVIRRVLPDLEAEVIVYCASGPCQNSGILARRLEDLGFTQAQDFTKEKRVGSAPDTISSARHAHLASYRGLASL
jgi:rhodanese-related sulfurtransferase